MKQKEKNENFSTLHSEKIIFGSGDASVKNSFLPSLATANWDSSTLCSEESHENSSKSGKKVFKVNEILFIVYY